MKPRNNRLIEAAFGNQRLLLNEIRLRKENKEKRVKQTINNDGIEFQYDYLMNSHRLKTPTVYQRF